ncbi:MAG: formylglycine-generating enzyme family protein [Capnocytophaga sp.]|nr:formylglycine-generating enzyme family protein [Capnocytophaga sp.]
MNAVKVNLFLLAVLNSFNVFSQSLSKSDKEYIGGEYLNKKFIKAIEKIKPNPDKVQSTEGMVNIKGGIFQMGGDIPENYKEMEDTSLPQGDEFPKHKVQVNDFYMDTHEVTIKEYMEFVQATGYKTTAEYDLNWKEMKKQLPKSTKKPNKKMLKAGALVFKYPKQEVSKNDFSDWWIFVKGASWKNPDGENKDLQAILNLPVTQISWYDALAYARWVGKRLPTEAEFEYAMRSGQENTIYTWGNDRIDAKTKRQGNFWQGQFPYHNTSEDGYEFLAPVGQFPPNGYGLYDLAGNAWEWTSDWYSPFYYEQLKKEGGTAVNPQGPLKSIEILNPKEASKVIRGGSFLCNEGWCSGYRNSRRMRVSPDSGLQHLGFRLVRDVTPKQP